MPSWGSGAPWGSGEPWGSSANFVSTMVGRILRFEQSGPQIVAFVNALANRTARLLDASQAVIAAFNLDTAVGEQLDRIGALLQRPRYGFDDDRYRALIRIQIDLILSSTGNTETLLAVFERLTGNPAAEYQEFYPAQFTIGGVVDPDDVELLASLIRQARLWGVYGELVAYPDGAAPGEGGVLLGDLVTDEGLWSLTEADRTFAVRMSSTGATDIETGTVGTLDGTTHVPAFEARNFNGATDRIDFASQPNLVGVPFSVSFWIRRETQANDARVWNCANGDDMFVDVRTNGAVRIFWDAATTPMQRQSAAAVVPLGSWVHVTVKGDGTGTAANYEILIDGEPVASYATTTNAVGALDTTAGRWTVGGRFANDTNNFDGDIASVDVYSRELGPEEVYHLYEEGIAATGSFAGPPDDAPLIDNPGVGDLATPTYALAYPTATLVTV